MRTYLRETGNEIIPRKRAIIPTVKSYYTTLMCYYGLACKLTVCNRVMPIHYMYKNNYITLESMLITYFQ